MSQPDSSPSTDKPGLRIKPLLQYLAAAVDVDPDRPLEAALLAGGRSNLSYVLAQGDQMWVLRRPPLGHVMPTAHDMRREYRVLTGLFTAEFPVPRPLLLCTDDSVIGAPFLLMDHVDGRVIADAHDAKSLSPNDASEISHQLVQTLARLHTVDVAAAGLDGLGRPNGYLARQVRRWAQQWDRTKTRELASVPALVSALEQRVSVLPTTMPWSVVHGDYRLDNVILDPTGTGIRAVVDWEMSTLGDPVADLAVMLVYWSRPGDVLRHRIPVATGVTDGPGFWDRPDLVRMYGETSGHDLAHLDTCIALACLKLAVIMESIHYRTLAGHQVGAARDELAMGSATEALAALGHSVLLVGVDGLSR
jgi:aminoglycoside phosphotransferase (APT) family kinase protein